MSWVLMDKQGSLSHLATLNDKILDMMYMLNVFEATDPREKVYALLGIASYHAIDERETTIDYRLSEAMVLTNLARSHVADEKNLNFLVAAAGSVLDDHSDHVQERHLGLLALQSSPSAMKTWLATKQPMATVCRRRESSITIYTFMAPFLGNIAVGCSEARRYLLQNPLS